MRSVHYSVISGLAILIVGILLSAKSHSPETSPSLSVSSAFRTGVDQMISKVERLKETAVSLSQDDLQAQFLDIREAYKSVEYLFAYIEPELTIQKINGAPLPKVDPMEEVMPVVISPVGLQVMDELIFEDEWGAEDATQVQEYCKLLLQELTTFRYYHASRTFTDRQILEATRAELIRLYTLGLTGFDTPGSATGMKDAVTVMQVLDRVIQLYADQASARYPELTDPLSQTSTEAIEYLVEHQDFNSFDRLEFLKSYLDPLYGGLYDLHMALGFETIYEVSPFPPDLNYRAKSLFSDSLLLPGSYLGYEAALMEEEMIELGKLLFFDPVLSYDLSRSCASCHHPDKAFSDGLAKSTATGDQGTLDRNSPTLLNSVYADRFFHDLRTSKMEMQLDHVVYNEKEFNTDFAEIIHRLKKSDEYQELFHEAFPGQRDREGSSITASTLKSAMAAYVGSLRSFHSPFDRYARGESEELPEAAKRGYNLFMGKAVCGTCHFAPTFAGLVPPDFKDSESEILGVPSSPIWEDAEVDPDYGRSAGGVPLDAAEIYAYSFKTPTVRNIALTAPYMHNGVYDSLEQVVRFYNVGGGSGIGIDLEHQTLPFDNLSLTAGEMSDLVAFMETLTDTTGMTSVPNRLPAFEAHPEWNDRKIGGEY